MEHAEIVKKLIWSEEKKQAFSQFINDKMAKSKMFDKYGLTLIESNEIIVRSLTGELRNIVLGFFSGKCYKVKKCDACETCDNTLQYDRAHDKSMDRTQVALAALKRIRPDESQPISQKLFMKAFVEAHVEYPLWYLCKLCHRNYDSVCVSETAV
jgi:hypothetical protein